MPTNWHQQGKITHNSISFLEPLATFCEEYHNLYACCLTSVPVTLCISIFLKILEWYLHGSASSNWEPAIVTTGKLYVFLCVRRCFVRWSLRINFLSHSLQPNRFSPGKATQINSRNDSKSCRPKPTSCKFRMHTATQQFSLTLMCTLNVCISCPNHTSTDKTHQQRAHCWDDG